jgi:signal transduction histidine kinase/ActR/RegA family two-component response regulator
MESSATAAALPSEGRRRRPVGRWWLRLPVRAKGIVVVALPLAALLIVTTASLILQHTEQGQRTMTHAATGLNTTASQVLLDAVNAETGVRGYIATANPAFLTPYLQALARTGTDRRALSTAAARAGVARPARQVIASSVTVMADLAQLRALVASGETAARLAPRMLQGKSATDVLRQRVASLTRGPMRLLSEGRSSINGLETDIDRVSIGGLILGLLAGVAGSALFTTGLTRRIAVSSASASQLGEGRPLPPVPPGGDELSRLDAALAQAGQLLASRAAELVTARDQAVRANQAKDAFLSNTSHELRTPLNSILGFTQLLQLSELGAEDQDSVERILGAGRHLLALINELIDVARIESGELSLSLEPVPLVPLADEAAQLLRPLAAERTVRIIQSCASPALVVRADRQRLSQVLVNLISNAIKYNLRGGTITISCHATAGSQVRLAVADTGPGLTADELERIFLPFERLGAERHGTEGTGIGLPLARGLAEAMGGRLTAESTPGKGSVFTVSLPREEDADLRPPAAAAAAPAPAAARHPGAPRLSVLYIEDNPASVEVVTRYLRGRGDARLRTASSGQAGLAAAVREVPDIILLDLHLGDLRGEEVLRELRTEPATAAVPVIILSAEASSGMIRRLIAAGAAGYLTKPVQLAELGALLDETAAARPPGAGQ